MGNRRWTHSGKIESSFLWCESQVLFLFLITILILVITINSYNKNVHDNHNAIIVTLCVFAGIQVACYITRNNVESCALERGALSLQVFLEWRCVFSPEEACCGRASFQYHLLLSTYAGIASVPLPSNQNHCKPLSNALLWCRADCPAALLFDAQELRDSFKFQQYISLTRVFRDPKADAASSGDDPAVTKKRKKAKKEAGVSFVGEGWPKSRAQMLSNLM